MASKLEMGSQLVMKINTLREKACTTAGQEFTEIILDILKGP